MQADVSELRILTVTPELVRCAIASLRHKWTPHPLYHYRCALQAEQLDNTEACQALVDKVVHLFNGGPYEPEPAKTEPIVVLTAHKVKPMLRLSLLDSLVHETAYLATYPYLREYIFQCSPQSHGHTLVFPSAEDCGLVAPYTAFNPERLWATESNTSQPTHSAQSKQPATFSAPYIYTCDIRQCSESVIISRLVHQLRQLRVPDTLVIPLEKLWRAHSVTGDTGLPYNFDAATWGWLNLYFLPLDRQFTQLGLTYKRSYDSYYFPIDHPRHLRSLLKTVVPLLGTANFHINQRQSFIFPNATGLLFYCRQGRLTLDLLLSGRVAWVLGSGLYCLGFRPQWLETHLIHMITMDCPRRMAWLYEHLSPFRWKSISRLCERFFTDNATQEPCLSFMLWQTLNLPPASQYSQALVSQWAYLSH